MCYNLCAMRTTLQTALAFCLISTVACAAVAPHAKFEDGMLSKTRPAGWLDDALNVSETSPEGTWRTCNHWVWRDKETTITEALKKGMRERSAKGDDTERIDYIYVSRGTKVLDYKTIASPRLGTKLYPSDHFPSVATLVFEGDTK